MSLRPPEEWPDPPDPWVDEEEEVVNTNPPDTQNKTTDTQRALWQWQDVDPAGKEVAYAALLDMRDTLRKAAMRNRLVGLTLAASKLEKRADTMNTALAALGYKAPEGSV